MKQDVMKDLRIDADRLYQSLEQLSQVGAFLDEVSGVHGVRRLALSE